MRPFSSSVENDQLELSSYTVGLYLASAASDNLVVVWDVPGKSKLAEQELPSAAVSLAWRPQGNALMCMTLGGELAVWRGAVPGELTGPCEAAGSPARGSQRRGGSAGASGAEGAGNGSLLGSL